jgi:hypothetical protein
MNAEAAVIRCTEIKGIKMTLKDIERFMSQIDREGEHL